MNLILLVGPSRVGKTTLATRCSSTMGYKHIDMDIELGASDLKRAKNIIHTALADTNNFYILDFGAGFQNQDQLSYDFFSPYRDNMVTIYAESETVHKRHGSRPKEEFIRTEYRNTREEIYNLSAYTIHNGIDIEKDAQILLGIIKELQSKN